MSVRKVLSNLSNGERGLRQNLYTRILSPCQRIESQNDAYSLLPFLLVEQHLHCVQNESLEPAGIRHICVVQRNFKQQTRPTSLVFYSSHETLLLIYDQVSLLHFVTLNKERYMVTQ